MVTTVAEIGSVVRSTRQSLGLKQDVLAAAAGVGTRFVVELEAGKPTIQLEKAVSVLVALGLSLEVSGAPA